MAVKKRQVKTAALMATIDAGWKYDAIETDTKLTASLKMFGQILPVITREDEHKKTHVVDGRRIVRALHKLGIETTDVVHMGTMTEHEASRLMLALRLRFRTDYSRLAFATAAVVSSGVEPEDLATTSPFVADRIRHFTKLTVFDWSQFNEVDEAQHSIDWTGQDDVAEMLPTANVAGGKTEDTEPLTTVATDFQVEHAPAPEPEKVTSLPSGKLEQASLW